jgi:hypothetical protein
MAPPISSKLTALARVGHTRRRRTRLSTAQHRSRIHRHAPTTRKLSAPILVRSSTGT